MSLLVNVTQLREGSLVLAGTLPPESMELTDFDELIHADTPLEYRLEAQLLDQNILVRGGVKMLLRCECVRCLKSFKEEIELPDWSCFLTLSGEDEVEVINDYVDLTPYIREDIVLALPRNPVCGNECPGLQKLRQSNGLSMEAEGDKPSDAWVELKKLNLES